MNPPVKPVPPEHPLKTRLERREIKRLNSYDFPMALESLPVGAMIDLDIEQDYGSCDVEVVIFTEENVTNRNYEEEVKKFDIDYANYCDAMERYKAEMKAWKKDERNRKDLIKANKDRIKQLQDEIANLKAQGS